MRSQERMRWGKAESSECEAKMGVRWGLGEAGAGGLGGAKSFDPGEWAVTPIPGSHTRY